MSKIEIAAKCHTHVSAAKWKKQFNYPSSELNHQGRFNKAKLPLPIDVLNSLGISVKKTNRSGYLVICCPFHKDGNETHPSFNIHITHGNYRCHACGVTGGDILAFYMNVTGKEFIEAAKHLGAWGYE